MSNSTIIPKSHVTFIQDGSLNMEDDLPEVAEVLFFVNKFDETGMPKRKWVTRIPLKRVIMDCQRNPAAIPDGSGVIILDNKMRHEILGEEIVKRFYDRRVDGWTLEERSDGSGLLNQPVILSDLSYTQQQALSEISTLSEEEANLVIQYAKKGRAALQSVENSGMRTINTTNDFVLNETPKPATQEEQGDRAFETSPNDDPASSHPTQEQEHFNLQARKQAVMPLLTQQQLALLPEDKRKWKKEHVLYAEQLVGEQESE